MFVMGMDHCIYRRGSKLREAWQRGYDAASRSGDTVGADAIISPYRMSERAKAQFFVAQRPLLHFKHELKKMTHWNVK